MKREVRKRTKLGGKKFNIFPCRRKIDGKACMTKTRWRICTVNDIGETQSVTAVCPDCLRAMGIWEDRIRDAE